MFEKQFELLSRWACMKQTTNGSAVNCENKAGTVHTHLCRHWFNAKCIHMTHTYTGWIVYMHRVRQKMDVKEGLAFFFLSWPCELQPYCKLLVPVWYSNSKCSVNVNSALNKRQSESKSISLDSLSNQQSSVANTETFTDIPMTQMVFKCYISKVLISGTRRKTQNRKCH